MIDGAGLKQQPNTAMSTRATIHFKHERKQNPVAIIYRHSDGYRDGLGKDLQQFFKDVNKQTDDPRFNDPAYLAAKWVVWDAGKHAGYYSVAKDGSTPLAFLGVGVLDQDPLDIEFRYEVICDNADKPKVFCTKV